MASQTDQPADSSDKPESVEPTDAEIEAWAARERERRKQWLSGPTPEQAAVEAGRASERPAARRPRRGRSADPAHSLLHSARTAQLATEGAVRLLLRVRLNEIVDRLVEAGHEWEDEYSSQHPPRRRATAAAEPPDAVQDPRGSAT
jgi:hypothetical protein